MNYIQMFANGGKTSDQDIIIGALNQIGITDENEIAQYLQVAMNKYGSFAGIGQALKEVLQGVSSDEELQSAIASVFDVDLSAQQESQMFKCGGKLQQLVSRFGKGGPVNCGCGGIKINQRGGVADEGDLRQQGPFYNLQHLVYRNSDGKYMGPDGAAFTTSRIATNGGNQEYTVFHPDLQSQLNNNLNIQRYMWNPRIFPVHYPHTSTFRTDPNGNVSTLNPPKAISLADTEKYQEGGIVLEQLPGHDVNTNLTRRQARQLAAQNQGYSGEQFNFAMANAINALRNQGLRGKELRERAREMAAGISPVQRTIVEAPVTQQLPEGFGNAAKITAPAQLVLPETQTLLDSMLDQTNATLTKRLQTSGKRTGDQTPVFVGSTPASKNTPTPEQQARIARGQAREQASNATRAKAQQTPVESSQSIVDTPDYTTGYMWTPEASKYYVHASNWSSLFDNPYAVRMHSAPVQQTSTSQQYPLTGNERAMAEQVYGYPARKPQASAVLQSAIPVRKCGGTVKSKEGIKLAKCGKKIKK